MAGRQEPAGGHRGRLEPGDDGHSRLERHDLARRRRAFPVGERANSRLRGDAAQRRGRQHVLRHQGDARVRGRGRRGGPRSSVGPVGGEERPMTPRLWDVIGARKWGYALSVLLIVPGVIALIMNAAGGRGALNWGIDFTGGDLLQLKLERPFTVGQIRAVVDQYATGESVIQKAEQEVFIRTRPLKTQARSDLLAALRRDLGTVRVLREETVGPKIGRELRNIAILAVVIGLALQVLYISYRFKSIRYALTAG